MVRLWIGIWLVWCFEISVIGVTGLDAWFPHLILIFVVYAAFNRDALSALLTGLFAGFLMDVAGSEALGFNMFVYAVAGWVLYILREKMFPDSALTQILGTAAAYAGILASTYFAFDQDEFTQDQSWFWVYLAKSTIWTTALAAPWVIRTLKSRQKKPSQSRFARRFSSMP